MTLWFRLLWLALRLPFRGRLSLEETSRLRTRAWPSDCDFNLHMNNAKYLALMDLGRLDMVVRTGLLSFLWRRKAMAVIGGADMTWRRSVRPFQPFMLETSVSHWDDKWFHLTQRFVAEDGTLLAEGLVRGVFLVRGKAVAPAQVLNHMGETA